MNDVWRKTFLLWGVEGEHKAKVELALNEIMRIHREYRGYYVAFSGGKDSIVLLHLTLQVNPDVDVFHLDYGPWLMPREVEKEIIDIAFKLGVRKDKFVVVALPEFMDERIREDPTPYYEFMREELPRICREKGWEAVLLGLRSEESVSRRVRLRGRRWHWGAYVEAPLKEWKWIDVWAYIVSHNLPYPSVYDKYAEVIGYNKARLVTFFDKEFERFGSPYIDGMLMAKHRYPYRNN